MSTPDDSVAPTPPTGSSNPWPLMQWFKRICDWIAGLSPSGADKYDTRWVELTLLNGWTVSGGITPRVRRIGNIVHMEGRVEGGSGNVATLPAEFRPSGAQRFVTNSGTSTTVGGLAIFSNGNVQVGSSLSQPNLSATWFVG